MDVDRFEALHHADVVYNVSGNTIISGRYDSFAALKQVLPAIFAALDFDRGQRDRYHGSQRPSAERATL